MSDLQFLLYYPQEITPGSQKKLHFYAFRENATDVVSTHIENGHAYEEAPITEVKQREMLESPNTRVILHFDGSEETSISSTDFFYKNWLYFAFDIKPQTTPINQFRMGKVTFMMDGVILADIPISIYVTEHMSQEQTVRVSYKAYERIFCSYSQEDSPISERIERVCRMLGLSYLSKVILSRNKQSWNAKTRSLINDAQIFQLFWSRASAQSSYIEKEWRYACQLDRPDFVRPVYWTVSMPSIPQELTSFEFLYEPSLWIDLKYTVMPLEQLGISEHLLNVWKRYGFNTVGEVMELLESAMTGQIEPMHISRHLIRDIGEVISRLEALKAWPPSHLQ